MPFHCSNLEAREGVKPKKKPDSDKEFKISFMLLLVACLYIFTKLPEVVIVQTIKYYNERLIRNQIYANVLIAWPVSNLLLIINHRLILLFMSFSSKHSEIPVLVVKERKM